MPLILVSPYRKLVAPISRAYAVWNRSRLAPGAILDTSNLALTTAFEELRGAIATIGKSSGKWYWEVDYLDESTSGAMIGVGLSSAHDNSYPYWNNNGVFYYPNGSTYFNTAETKTSNTYAKGDTIGIALDADTRRVHFYKNGVLVHTNLTCTGFVSGSVIYPIVGDGSYSAVAKVRANFGATAFKYSVPSGFNPGLY